MKQRPIMIGETVHEKLMELKKSLEEKLDEQVSFNAFLMMMLEEFERLNEAVRTPEEVKREKETERPFSWPRPWSEPAIIGQPIIRWDVRTTDTTNKTTIPSTVVRYNVRYNFPKTEQTYGIWTKDCTANISDGNGPWYHIEHGETCSSCGHPSVVKGVCDNCGVSQ